MRKLQLHWVLIPLLAFLAVACSSDYGTAPDRWSTDLVPFEPDEEETPQEPPENLISGCYGWPYDEFSEDNGAPIATHLDLGDEYVDIELADLEGNRHRLSDFLATKPVLLKIGSYTCPSYQRSAGQLNAIADRVLPDGRRYGDAVHIVHVYTVEAHPKAPDFTPYYGQVAETEYSIVRQARTYEARVENARQMAPLLGAGQLLLVDELELGGIVNPVWCTYGSAPDCVFLIDQDGTIKLSNVWADMKAVGASIANVANGRDTP